MPLYAPAPVTPQVTFTLRSTGALVDVPNAEIRVRSPSGTVTVLPVVRLSLGTYAVASTFVCDGAGPWHFEGHSPVVGDLVKASADTITVDSTGFPSSSSSLPATAAWDGNPFASYSVVTTDATPTLLVRVPIAADQAIELMFDMRIYGRRLDTGATCSYVGEGLIKRVGSASPVGDASNGGYWTGPIFSTATSPYNFQPLHGDVSLNSSNCYLFANADSVDVFVVGVAGITMRWGMTSPGWSYL